jgi:sRNA-binding carbon storage regulator CsrA
MRTTGPKGKQLSVGIEAPSDVVIQRYKIYEENLLKLAEEGDTDAYDKAAQLIQERQARSQKRLRAQAKLKQRQAAKAV